MVYSDGSLEVYFQEKVKLNEREELVYNCIKDTPGVCVDDIMEILGIDERNGVAPRCSDLKTKGLIKVIGKKKNRYNHTVEVFMITNGTERDYKKRVSTLDKIMKLVDKLSHEEMLELSNNLDKLSIDRFCHECDEIKTE